MPQSNLGRHIFGTAVVGSGLASLIWHHGPIYLYAPIAAQIAGGIAIQLRPAARVGAMIIGAGYLVLALRSIPGIIALPQVYYTWGNFFYPVADAIGAGAAYALLASAPPSKMWIRIGCILFAMCNASFAIEQVEFLARTASLVPKWIPPSQMFWAIITTAPFALAAIALIVNRVTMLATRLLAAMYWCFGLLVWVPILITNPHTYSNWSEGTETVAIGAAAWLLADLIARARPT